MNFTALSALAPPRSANEIPARGGSAPEAGPEIPAVAVSHLRKAYKKVKAVNDISFTVAPGEIVGLLGPNGAGKTTTLEMILGLRKPDEGTVRLYGIEVSASDRRFKTMIGAQLQRTDFPGKWKTFEVLDLFATFYPHPLPPEELLDRFGLREKRNALVETLSGGQVQRLGLAVALVGRPRVVCLDEPTSGLDAHARRSLWDLIEEMRKSGLTLLITTHSMEEAERLCDRVAIIDAGCILAMEPPRQLIQHYFPERAIQFETPQRQELEFLERLPAVSRVQRGGQDLYTLFTADPMPTLAALLEMAATYDLALTNVQIRSATLEDVFLQMTGRRIQP